MNKVAITTLAIVALLSLTIVQAKSMMEAAPREGGGCGGGIITPPEEQEQPAEQPSSSPIFAIGHTSGSKGVSTKSRWITYYADPKIKIYQLCKYQVRVCKMNEPFCNHRCYNIFRTTQTT